jgi:hypothetical protein
VTLKGVEPKVRADLDLHKFRTYRGHVNIKKTLGRNIAAGLANDEDHAKLNAKRKDCPVLSRRSAESVKHSSGVLV